MILQLLTTSLLLIQGVGGYNLAYRQNDYMSTAGYGYDIEQEVYITDEDNLYISFTIYDDDTDRSYFKVESSYPLIDYLPWLYFDDSYSIPIELYSLPVAWFGVDSGNPVYKDYDLEFDFFSVDENNNDILEQVRVLPISDGWYELSIDHLNYFGLRLDSVYDGLVSYYSNLYYDFDTSSSNYFIIYQDDNYWSYSYSSTEIPYFTELNVDLVVTLGHIKYLYDMKYGDNGLQSQINDWINQTYDDAYDEGYNDGYNDGVNDTYNTITSESIMGAWTYLDYLRPYNASPVYDYSYDGLYESGILSNGVFNTSKFFEQNILEGVSFGTSNSYLLFDFNDVPINKFDMFFNINSDVLPYHYNVDVITHDSNGIAYMNSFIIDSVNNRINIENLYSNSVSVSLMYVRFEDDYSIIGDIVSLGTSYNTGYNIGYDKGYANGYIDGEDVGIIDGENNVIRDPNNYDLYNENQYEENYRKGYQQGALNNSSIEERGFLLLFNSILNAPYNILNGILNFEIFGINLFDLVSFVLSLAIIGVVVAIIMGRRK